MGGASRVFYSVDAALPSWVPGFVVNAVTKKALTDATSWVKVESEKVQPPPTWLAWATSSLRMVGDMVGDMVGAVSWYDVWLPATAKVCLLNAVALFSVALILRAAEAHR